MAKVLAWCVEKEDFEFEPGKHMPVGVGGMKVKRKRVTFAYAVLNPSPANGKKRDSITSYPLSLMGTGNGKVHARDLYDNMPAHTERGHLIADVFGGADDERNLVPMSRQFNQQTWKQQVESTLKTHATQRGDELLGMKIRCVYGTLVQDPRIPVGYIVHLYTFGKKDALQEKKAAWGLFFSSTGVRAIPLDYHPPAKALFAPLNVEEIQEIRLSTSLPSPVLPNDNVSIVTTKDLASLQAMAATLKTPLIKAQQAMVFSRWKVENTVCAREYDFKLPPVHQRPYAVLDYMLWKGVLGELFPDLAKKKLNRCFSSKGFEDWQRELIFAANMVLHRQTSFLISDNESDDVYREVHVLMDGTDPGERSTMGRYEYAVREWRNGLPATSPEALMRLPRGALFLDSTAFAPQIDHIVAKAGAKNGIDAFSNAQVVSGKWNRVKSDQAIVQGVVERARVPRTLARPSKFKVDYSELHRGRAERNSGSSSTTPRVRKR